MVADVVVMVEGWGCDAMLLLLLTAGILVVVLLAAPLGRADIGAAVATMTAHCCCAPEGGRW
jgi:hypothetical protein